MFITGNDETTKITVTKILDQFGWETADMGGAGHRTALHTLVHSGLPPERLGTRFQTPEVSG